MSARHAQITNQGGQLLLEDLGSGNGTFVRGQRLARGQKVPVANGEKVYIGPMPVLIHIAGQQVNVVVEDQQASWAGKPLYEIEAWDLFLEVPDRDNKAEMKILLDHVSFKALPGDMIALMGPSGAGKTTLLLTLNGYLPPTSGQVRINGDDLYAVYDALRGVIGYVPQDDIVHPELTVFEAVKYSARFRLPNDYSEQEINARVEQTLKRPRPRGACRTSRSESPRRRCSPAVSESASTSRSSSSPIPSSSSSTSPPRVSPPTTRRRSSTSCTISRRRPARRSS